MPSPEQRRKIRSQSEIMSVPYFVVKTDHSRGKTWADQWKAKDAKRSATRKNHDSIVLRWQNDEHCRTVHGWTEEYCLFLDFIASVDTSHVATCKERERNENNLTLGTYGGPPPGPLTRREDFHEHLVRLQPSEMKKDTKPLRERRRPFDEKLRPDLDWHSWNWNVNWSRASSSSSTVWCQSGNGVNHKENGKISNGGKSGEHSLFFNLSVFLQDSCTLVVLFFAYRH